MKLAISNIAWDHAEDEAIAEILERHSVRAIEVAPPKIWDEPAEAQADSIFAYRTFWTDKGVELVAMQSILFNKPHMQLFAGESARELTKNYIVQMIKLAAQLGTKAIVFGSPKNRLVQSADDYALGLPFFNQLGSMAHEHGVFLCIEPNPPQYGANYVVNTTEAIELVKAVNNPGFRLHLDLSSLILNEEPIEERIQEALPYVEHFHISEPFLELIGQHAQAHERAAAALRKFGYGKFVSIEMKNGLKATNIEAIQEALDFAQSIYK